MDTFPDYTLAILAKAPEFGKAKTRLQPAFPKSFSLSVHKTLLDYLLQQHYDSVVCSLSLWLTGDINAFYTELPQWQSLSVSEQKGQDLGERMNAIVNNTLLDSKAVILIGSDCPFIDTSYIQMACMELQSHDVVIGPASDGGYVLLGLKSPEPKLFKDIEWGSEKVYEQTIKAIQKQCLSVSILPILNDIDRPEDIEQLKEIPFFANCF